MRNFVSPETSEFFLIVGDIIAPMRLQSKLLFLLAFFLAACTIPASSGPTANPSVSATPAASAVAPTLPAPTEVPITIIPLAGPITKPEAEISGMAWFSDTLILLPQYPTRFGAGDGALLGISRAEIVAFLRGEKTQPIQPIEIPLIAPDTAKIAGFEGFEAIAFSGNQVFLTIEANLGKMAAYLVSGEVAPDLSRITLDIEKRVRIESQTGISNLSDEAVLIAGERVMTFYEANGAAVNPQPVTHLFDLSLTPQGELAFPNLEYRLTDATPPDAVGRFWVINYFYPGDTSLKPKADPLAEMYGLGLSHTQAEAVERLVEYQFTEGGINRTDAPPIWLELLDNDEARNWEGIARVDVEGVPPGFLLVSDKFPTTLLAYIPSPVQR